MNVDAAQTARTLYDLLPAFYRRRDAEQGFPLRELVAVIAEQTAVVQESLEQAYDDLFIETCAPWAIAYIGDLIGAQPLHGRASGAARGRAEVAETLGLRRGKGTLAVLEQIARVVTGYPTVAVEFFQRLSQQQYVQNHVRSGNLATVDLRNELALERIATAFNSASHLLEVRRLTSGRGRYNIPNIGLYLFRTRSQRLRGATAARVDDFRATFDPLGIDTALYNEPATEQGINQFAGPEHVPMPISRLLLKQTLGTPTTFYGADRSLAVYLDGVLVPETDVVLCHLGDALDGSGAWAHAPADVFGIDPVLGRLALPTGRPAPTPGSVTVDYRYGVTDDLGGGEYERGAEIIGAASQTLSATTPDVQAALTASGGGGIVEWQDSRTYDLVSASPNLAVAAGQAVELRAANGVRPVIALSGGDLVIDAGDEATVTLNGLVVVGGALRITGTPQAVTLRHCTFVPGISRTRQNEPAQPERPSLVIMSDTVTVTLERCIVGAIEAANGAVVVLTTTIVDATDETRVAFSGGLDGGGVTTAGGSLSIDTSTIIGRIHAQRLPRASNTLFLARVPPASPALPLRVERTQDGCVRFSVVPIGSRTPRRYRCLSEATRLVSTRFGAPGYYRLSRACAETIRHGADDESEIGVYHDLYHPQRESDLRTRLNEYLRFGMEAGIFDAS